MISNEQLIHQLKSYEETLWINLNKNVHKTSEIKVPTLQDIQNADNLLRKFSSFFESAFPETQPIKGLIESPLMHIPAFQNGVIPLLGGRVVGNWYLKADHLLPISGSIKARGGVYEILKYAERLALEAGLITLSDDYFAFHTDAFKNFFSKHTLVVGSTGNLGLSIGTIGRALGFNVSVHMSKDAKTWKIEKLKSMGVQVILHDAKYSEAVARARHEASHEKNTYFVDDENSRDLFTGYAVAALRLEDQLKQKKIPVDADHPLFVYLPCGVGGAPGGIAHGLKEVFGKDVYIFLAEPTHAPCMLLGMATEKYSEIDVADIGIDLQTDADGLAVGKASSFAGQAMAPIIDGIYTISDDRLFFTLYVLHETESIDLEPSALAGLLGPMRLFYNENAFQILVQNQLLDKMENATHISWATGGSMVPTDIMFEDIKRGALKSMTF
ncbi:D-serine ammonia-lyase [Fusibacter tunisiensis]|uniref:Probable D-serine dehydratase n=1 Tax=Fusibacter tunisiensis TaxID=1008308 RepID=A0ABS2MRK4_9FIRM|nr:D-serine ammonia-lyase [Fusibacter tunisiensis]MBM7562044.1 D-serine dehydratase [Fusibacter tunisiensis]